MIDALKRLSVGGVVFNEYDEILLIEPTDHFDGYVWTFPKGSPNKEESFESAAKREVLEETGVVAEIVGLVPGQFDGGTTVNSYFIMRTTGSEGPIESNEVMNTAWVSSGRAAAMIAQTTNDKGKQRDLEILKAAIGVKDLLSTNVGSIKAPPHFPAGNYIVVIESFEMLPFSWKKSGTHGLSYVPKVRAVSCVELDDDSNPELQTEMQEALEVRKQVERAKGFLMASRGLSEPEAFRLMQRQSMNLRKSMREIADAIILAEELHQASQS